MINRRCVFSKGETTLCMRMKYLSTKLCVINKLILQTQFSLELYISYYDNDFSFLNTNIKKCWTMPIPNSSNPSFDHHYFQFLSGSVRIFVWHLMLVSWHVLMHWRHRKNLKAKEHLVFTIHWNMIGYILFHSGK